MGLTNVPAYLGGLTDLHSAYLLIIQRHNNIPMPVRVKFIPMPIPYNTPKPRDLR